MIIYRQIRQSGELISFGIVLLFLFMAGCSTQQGGKPPKKKKPPKDKGYNVLFIAIDDMNDYVSLLKDFPGVKMPNMDDFAKTAVTFKHAYAAAPVCHPSRTSVLTGISPIRTGVMNNGDWFQRSSVAVGATLLAELFKENGYHTMWSGKIYHTTKNPAHSRPKLKRLHAIWDDMRGHDGGYGPFPKGKAKHTPYKWFDWQTWKGSSLTLPDIANTNRTIKRLQQDYNKPFFMALGLYRPHTPWSLPQRFFDMHPLGNVQTPAVLAGDTNDVPAVGRKYAGVGLNLDGVKNKQLWKPLIKGYLSAISFTDYNVGRVLDALDDSPYRDSTIVVLWADNGFHMGEKGHFGKKALWELDDHVLLMMRVPGVKQSGFRDQPVSLLDIYPTLVQLCNLTSSSQSLDEQLSGQSLVPILRDKNYDRKKPAITYYHRGKTAASGSVRTLKWRYIRYYKGGEELYNEQEDPHEWHNLANDPQYTPVIAKLSKWLKN